jgi:dolichyl-phosphate beta-glucosyltransferase
VRYTIVVPAYNEEGRLRSTLEALMREMPAAEVLVVDDGSTDRTSSLAESLGARALRHDANRGKGAAIRTGFAAAAGDVVGFTDADGSTDAADVRRVFESVDGHDVVIASRRLPGSVLPVDQPLHRRLAGTALRYATRLALGLRIRDTQCGCKAMKRRVIDDILPKLSSDGFEIDMEILYLAKNAGYSILETPVKWTDHRESKVSALRDGTRMLAGLIRIRLRRRG